MFHKGFKEFYRNSIRLFPGWVQRQNSVNQIIFRMETTSILNGTSSCLKHISVFSSVTAQLIWCSWRRKHQRSFSDCLQVELLPPFYGFYITVLSKKRKNESGKNPICYHSYYTPWELAILRSNTSPGCHLIWKLPLKSQVLCKLY